MSLLQVNSVAMILIALVWLCLTTSMVYGTTITISSSGSNEADCCYSKRGGRCPCNSLSSALNHLQDDTTVNIVSDITLHDDDVEIYDLNNITISGNNVTVTCKILETYTLSPAVMLWLSELRGTNVAHITQKMARLVEH